MGNFDGVIIRYGRLRIIQIYNARDTQPAISIQLNSIDFPATYRKEGSWCMIDNNQTGGTRFLELTTNGLLFTSDTVVRGGFIMVYFTA